MKKISDRLTKQRRSVTDKVSHTLERFRNRLTLDNPKLAERYDKSELHILLHFRLEDGEEFVASLQREVPMHATKIGGRGISPVSLDGSRPLTWRHAVRSILRGNCYQKSVFVNLVKLVDSPESVAGVFVPTLVWLGTVNEVYGLLPHALYFSDVFGFVFRGTFTDRVACNTFDRSVTRGLYEPPRQIVKGTPQTMEGIARDDSNFRGNLRNTLSGLWVVLAPNSILVGFKERLTSEPKILDVLFGPFNFYPDAV